LVLARRADDGGAERAQKAVQVVDVGTLAGAETKMMQADALLLEGMAIPRRSRVSPAAAVRKPAVGCELPQTRVPRNPCQPCASNEGTILD
jgi:hypothetical protein